ncbi:hypothetical protein BH23CHL5_BH23CHL5_28360 [soil metagenome]
MAKQRKRPGTSRAVRESESQKHCPDSNRVPPHTPAPIAKALTRALRRLDDLADAGCMVTVCLGFENTHGEWTGVLIVDRETVAAVGPPPSPDSWTMRVGRRAQA